MKKILLAACFILPLSFFGLAQGVKADPLMFTQFECIKPDGTLFDFKQLEGKVVFVDFWTTWCGPCKASMPKVKELEKNYEGKDIVFLSISINADEIHDDWVKYVKSNDMAGYQVRIKTDKAKSVADKYSITYIPRMMLVNKKGEVVKASINHTKLGNPEIKAEIDKLLN